MSAPPPPPPPPPPPAPVVPKAPVKGAVDLQAALKQRGKVPDHIPERPKTPPTPPPDVLVDVTSKFIESVALFNLLQFGSQLSVIDVRTQDEFERTHIRSAISVPLEKCREHDLVDIESGFHLRFRQRRSNLVVIYGSSNSETLEFLECLKKDRRTTKTVLMLEGGISSFETNYPFLVKGNTKFTDDEFPSEICDNFLYLGNYAAARNRAVLDLLHITRIVNATDQCEMVFKDDDDFKYIQCALDDKPGCDIRQFFDNTLKFLEEAKKQSKRVLIHCQMGMSRSSTLVILWIMHTQQMNLRDATNFVREKRPFINPNPGFMQQLGLYEKEKFGETTIRFPEETITIRTVYDWLKPDGTWVPRKVVGFKDC
eukprot:m.267030 g.267030  ORF g.267030 m.267030 type:complete len:370 (+) comp16242_c0_seq4:95-1204(+)